MDVPVSLQELSTESLFFLLAEADRELKRRQPKPPIVSLQELSTESLFFLLAEADRELKRRQSKPSISILKEWEDAGGKNRSVVYDYINRRFGWVCVVSIVQDKSVETFSTFVFVKDTETWTKRESKRRVADKAVKECSFFKSQDESVEENINDTKIADRIVLN